MRPMPTPRWPMAVARPTPRMLVWMVQSIGRIEARITIRPDRSDHRVRDLEGEGNPPPTPGPWRWRRHHLDAGVGASKPTHHLQVELYVRTPPSGSRCSAREGRQTGAELGDLPCSGARAGRCPASNSGGAATFPKAHITSPPRPRPGTGVRAKPIALRASSWERSPAPGAGLQYAVDHEVRARRRTTLRRRKWAGLRSGPGASVSSFMPARMAITTRLLSD